MNDLEQARSSEARPAGTVLTVVLTNDSKNRFVADWRAPAAYAISMIFRLLSVFRYAYASGIISTIRLLYFHLFVLVSLRMNLS